MPDGDEVLVRRAQGGDAEAFGELYRRYAASLVGYLVAVLSRRQASQAGVWSDAEDLVQDAFRTAWRKLPSLRSPSCFPSWLRSIARNLSLTRRAMQLVTPGDGLEVVDQTDGIDVQVEDQERQMLLLQAVEQLRPEYRDVVHARYFRDPQPTFDELAEELETPAGTLRANVSRALKELRVSLSSEFFGE